MKINKEKFFNEIRSLFNPLRQSQVEGLDFIIDYFESQKMVKDMREFAYILATIQIETGATFQPIEEWGKGKGKSYGKKIDVDGKPYTTPDKLFYGMGYTQNTWLSNAKKLTKAAKENGYDWDFVNHPELYLEKEPSIWCTFYAMSTGLYTGRKLSDYFTPTISNWTGARAIVNGKDRALEIGELAKKYFSALI